MAETYKISAVPVLFPEGEFAGKLKGVTFRAVSATESRHWFTRNCGQFETAVSRIMHPSMARVMVATLTHGNHVELPGEYQEAQFERGFLLEWTPVHLVLPPQFAQGRAC